MPPRTSFFIICVFLSFWKPKRFESLAEYDQPTVDPGIFIFDEDFPRDDDKESESNSIIVGKEDACPSDGYYSNKEDCSLFHLCEKGAAYQFQCGPGLGFDPRLNACNWKARLGKSCDSKLAGPVECPSLKFFGDRDDPSVFYRCVGRRKVKFHCPLGLVYKPEGSLCDRRNAV